MNENIIHGPEPLTTIREDTVGTQLFHSLMKYQNVPKAMIDAVTSKSISYYTILEKSVRLYKKFKNIGLNENDTIGIFSENILQYFLPILAAMYEGIPATTFNSNYTLNEILHCARITNPKLLFCSKQTLSRSLELQRKLPCIKSVIVIDSEKQGSHYETLENYIQNISFNNANCPSFKSQYSLDNTAFILYSSGTTGLPKAVMLTHKNINTLLTVWEDPRFYPSPEEEGKYILGLLPFYHAYGLLIAFTRMQYGHTIVAMKQFDGPVFLQTIQDYKIKKLNVVPPLLVFLAKSPLVDQYDLSELKIIRSGGSTIGKEVMESVIKRLKIDSIHQGFGMTELTLSVTSAPLDNNKLGSCGKVLPYMSAKVIDLDTGKSLGAFKEGELCFKGSLVMKGYANNVEATKQTIDQYGWLHTGDIAYYDQDEYLYIIDRHKDLIKYKGFQVPPAEIEALLLTHAKVDDAAVIGIPDDIAGELPLAFVVKKPDQTITEGEIKQFISEQLSSQKQLRGGVKFLNAIPKNASGKILRKNLRSLIKRTPQSKL